MIEFGSRLRLPLWSALMAVVPVLLAAQDLPRFQSTSQLVIEPVTVMDRNGKPVEGLRAEDFLITENGVPQTIRLFEYQKLEDAPLPAFRESAALPAASEAAEITPGKPGEILYRNRRLLVLYFDLSAMGMAEQFRAFDSAQKFITTQITASDLVAIMEFSEGSVKVHQDFTADRDQLLATLNKMIAISQDLEEDTSLNISAFGQNDGEFNLFNSDRQLSALQTVFAMLGRLAERKSVIYFASGLHLNGVDNQAQLRATLNAAIRSNVVLFPIDARGLVAAAPMGDASRPSPGGVGIYTGAVAMSMAGSFQRSQDALYALAADTGGKAMLDYNDLSLGIVQAQKAMSSYYILGYYTTNGEQDGKWRKIEIALKEFPSARLAYRRGYFGPKEFKKFNAADRERQLEEALMLEDPITELTIAMEVNWFQLNRAEYYVPVVMKIPGSELALARKGGAERTRIDFIGEIRDEYNTTIANIRDKVEIEMSGATAAELVKRHIQYDTGYTLLPGSYSIKVLARDNETGRIGTYLSKFTIPNLNKETERIAISSVVLSSQRIDLKEALFTVGKDKEQIANPLVQDGQKMIPSVTRVFSRARDLYVYLQAYDQSGDPPRPLVAFVTFYHGNTKAFETPPLMVSERLNNRLRTMPLKFIILADKLMPGRYVAQVTVLDPPARKATFWQAPLMVVQ